ncbi:GspE/PulE family protein [Pseudomonas putida]|uniref:Flp pilus assembly complex ATPase component TadA n=1 Tax=Pseudomonas putida TaxID=303 RepID=A0A8I1ED01_PSEPU|nr:ATPase, T2SS/T4P/T4SS family [Pseudomonas putida]MBI6883003.1 Flp pilus assembly complex ATPase component TadA [Pseudomonas putida]
MGIFDFSRKKEKENGSLPTTQKPAINQGQQVRPQNNPAQNRNQTSRPAPQREQTPFQRAAAPKPAAAQAQPGSQVAQQRSNVQTSAGQPPRSFPVITKKDEIPSHSAVLSATNAPLELIPEWQKNYAILLISKDRKDVVIICSTENHRQGLDDDYLAIIDRINRAGYTRSKRILAKPEILAIIYESGSGQKTAEDQQRHATKIQIDFDDLIKAGIEADTSDIHIEVRRDEAKVRFRKNGDCIDFAEWPVKYARTMAGVIYQVIADEKDTTFDEARPQAAIIDRELSESLRIRVRLNTIPAYPAGFDMVMRILKMGQGGKRTPMDKLGYEKRQLSHIRRGVAKPVGAMIMAGTTGSGKSTSLNSMLGEKIEAYKGKLKVITVEDPPEYLLWGATQVPVVRSRSQAKAGDKSANPFVAVMSAALRSDPDILMVGEVRDEDSAHLLIHAVQSGHQVFTTVHASGAMDIIGRFRSMHMPDDVLGGQNFISALMYQTLLPTVCPHCSTDINKLKADVQSDQDEELIERIYTLVKPSVITGLRFRHDEGCEHCAHGVIGRSVAAEVILPDPYMLKCFRDRNDTEAAMHYRRKGGRSALEHGLSKAFRGIADIRDVESKLDQITLLKEFDEAARIISGIPLRKNFQIEEDVFAEITIEEIDARLATEAAAAPVELNAEKINQELPAPAEKATHVVEPNTPGPEHQRQFSSQLFAEGTIAHDAPKAQVMSFEAKRAKAEEADANNSSITE